MLVPGNGLRVKPLIFEIACQDEPTILLSIVPSETEKGVLGLEVADLQDAADLSMYTGAAAGERQFRFGQLQIGQPLPVV